MIWIPKLPLSGYLTSDKYVNISVLPYLQKGNNDSIYSHSYEDEINWFMEMLSVRYYFPRLNSMLFPLSSLRFFSSKSWNKSLLHCVNKAYSPSLFRQLAAHKLSIHNNTIHYDPSISNYQPSPTSIKYFTICQVIF